MPLYLVKYTVVSAYEHSNRGWGRPLDIKKINFIADDELSASVYVEKKD